MKNQKFFFSVGVVLFVLGVFALFFFGFKSRVFAKVKAISLVPEQQQVAIVDRVVTPKAVVVYVVNDVVSDKVENVENVENVKQVALIPDLVVTRVRNVETVAVKPIVQSVSVLVDRVPVDLSRQSAIV